VALVHVLFEEKAIKVGPVNLAVAQRACLEESVLIVETRSTRRSAKRRLRVALQAEQIHVTDLQHMRVGSAVDSVAGLATLNLDGFMFEDEWSLLISVAGKADNILGRRRSDLLGLNAAVDIVAIAALNQSFVHSVMERHVELRLLFEMAGIAKAGLGLD